MLHFDRIDVSEGIDVNKKNESNECIFQIKSLSLNSMSAISVMMY